MEGLDASSSPMLFFICSLCVIAPPCLSGSNMDRPGWFPFQEFTQNQTLNWRENSVGTFSRGWQGKREPRLDAMQVVWDIAKVNGLKDVLLIQDDSNTPDMSMTTWTCADLVHDKVGVLVPLPPLLTTILDCPGFDLLSIMEKAISAVSHNRSGILDRPVLSWLVTMTSSPVDDMTGFPAHLLSRADQIVRVQPYVPCHNMNQSVTALSKQCVGITTIVKSESRDLISCLSRVHPKWPNYTQNLRGMMPTIFTGFKGESVKVGVIEHHPFSYTTSVSNSSTWVGYALEFIYVLSEQYNFSVVLVESKDGNWGGKNPDGSWNGLVGMLLGQEIDVVATGLTASAVRMEVVDFCSPYVHDVFGLMLQVKTENWFSFLQPMQTMVWLVYGGSAVLLAFFIVIMSFLVERPSPCNSVTRASATLMDKITLPIGALCQQGSFYRPSRGSIKVLIWFFWLVVVIVTASYSGNLIASLSTERVKLPFTDVEGFSDQDEYLPIISEGTAQLTLLKESTSSVYQKLARKLTDNPDLVMTSDVDPLEKLTTGHYVYITDQVVLQATAAQREDCTFFTLSDGFGQNPLALAMPRDSPFILPFSNVVSQLMDAGVNERMFARHRMQDVCSERLRVSTNATPISLYKLTGLFVILLVGMTTSALVLGAEVLLKRYMYKRRAPHKEETSIVGPEEGSQTWPRWWFKQ